LAGWRGETDSSSLLDDLAAGVRKAGNAAALKSALWASTCLRNGVGRYERALTYAIEAAEQPWEWGRSEPLPELIEPPRSPESPGSRMRNWSALRKRWNQAAARANSIYARSHALLSTARAAEDL
jgi:hypothetical protein